MEDQGRSEYMEECLKDIAFMHGRPLSQYSIVYVAPHALHRLGHSPRSWIIRSNRDASV